ncbi:MAG: hypothetical protein FWC47_06900 [Oscillospiraceae bacterium]|nr:hypothetical protein [Oscillospiraceae bacterium]
MRTKDPNKLAELIKEERDRLSKYEKKKSEWDTKVQNCKEKLDNLIMLQNSQNFTILSEKLVNSGMSFEDIIKAISSGEMSSLKEKTFNNSNEKATSEQKTENSTDKTENEDFPYSPQLIDSWQKIEISDATLKPTTTNMDFYENIQNVNGDYIPYNN